MSQQSLLPVQDDIRPLADRMRPKNLAEFYGQRHLLSEGGTLTKALKDNLLHSMIFWGPPGTGKTTLASMIAHVSDAQFLSVSAVLSGVKEIRQAIVKAKEVHTQSGQRSILFVDEVHRFNKSQQDAFLPHVEDGTVIFIGATTENPSFELNNALLSRVRTYVLKGLSIEDIRKIIDRALNNQERGLAKYNVEFPPKLRDALAKTADGDARRALSLLELAVEITPLINGKCILDESVLKEVTRGSLRRFDKGGEQFYDQISALHKSIRGSSPDAALYWFCRMIDGGCDPRYIARRVLRIAAEDIGLADPRATQQAQFAWESYSRMGSPEGELAIAQAIVFMACAPKSNAVYSAYNRAMKDAREHGSREVPIHLRNAPTDLMKDLGYAEQYRYAHDEIDGFAAGECYFPESMGEQTYYEPVDRGLEIKIGEKLKQLKALNKQSENNDSDS